MNRIVCALSAAIVAAVLPITVWAEELPQTPTQPDYGFYTKDTTVQAAQLSGLSAQWLAETGKQLDLLTLAPVFTLTDAQLSAYDLQPLTEQGIAQQPYHAVLRGEDGAAEGYALLQYNYYTPDSDYVLEHAAQDAGFMAYYNANVADRLEITEMGTNAPASFDLAQNLAEIRQLLPQTALDEARTQARLINLTESVGYAILLTDTQNACLFLLDNNRLRDMLGLADTKMIALDELCDKLAELTALTPEQQDLTPQAALQADAASGMPQGLVPGASPQDEGLSAPPTGGMGTAENAAPSPHLPLLILAGALLVAAGGILLYVKVKEKRI